MEKLVDSRLIHDVITLFVVINPIGLVPAFIGLTAGTTAQERHRIARRGVLIAGAILLAFIVVGELVLDGLEVSLPAFRVAGGLVLVLIALRMLLSPGVPTQASEHDTAGEDVAVFPLAMPFIAGPGAITAAVLLTDNDRFGIVDQAVTLAVLGVILALTYAMLRAAEVVERRIGITGANVLGRVMGLILAAVAVQTLLTGVRVFFSEP
ncbi:MAG TPA: MarC family protein [Methylomirabilota bacterium]|nr:MarC family protein [Methylomirabilota bacterium]